jgi:tetratricopeptide (TPR) repeat protein
MDAGKHEMCPSCGANLVVFHKAILFSYMYYNEGLKRAEVRDLSGAIASLKNSLKFNKYNIEARNLLGLVYYEIGEVVDALSEWVISANYQKEDNLATRYIEEIRYDRAHLKECNQTIKKYNQALLYCQQDSRDLAIIQLKKVLSLNPKLVKAHQLMALLYIQEGRLEQAKRALRNAGKIDANNVLTLRYLKEVNRRLKEKHKDSKSKDEDLISYQSGNEMIIMPKRFQDFSLGSTLLYLIIGLIVGAAVIGFLVLPGAKEQARKEFAQSLVESNETISSQSQTISSLEKEIKELQDQVASLSEDAQKTPEEIASYEALLQGYIAHASGDAYAAGNYLVEVKAEHLSEDALKIYTPIWNAIASGYYERTYNKGQEFYNVNNFKDAIPLFLKVAEANPDYKDGYATYYLAQSYRRNGDMESARPYYQYILEHYPNTELARTAENYINEE